MGQGEHVWGAMGVGLLTIHNDQGVLAGERTFPWSPIGLGEPALRYLQKSGIIRNRGTSASVVQRGPSGSSPGQELWGP